MLEKIKQFLAGSGPLSTDKDGNPIEKDVRLATAVILLELAYGDEEYVRQEQRVLIKEIASQFGVGKLRAIKLLDDAEGKRPFDGEIAPLIEAINEEFSVEQRQLIITIAWKVVLADGKIEEFEEVFANHLANVLGLSEQQALDARAAAQES